MNPRVFLVCVPMVLLLCVIYDEPVLFMLALAALPIILVTHHIREKGLFQYRRIREKSSGKIERMDRALSRHAMYRI